MRCPSCGTDIPADSSACASCGQRFGRKVAASAEEEAEAQSRVGEDKPSYRYIGTESRPRRNWTKIVITIVTIVVFSIIPIAYDMGLFDPKPPEEQPRADLSGLLQWEAIGDLFGGEGGTISIHGDIHNYGDADGSGTVNMQVFDGYEWKDYHKGTGPVPMGGVVHFSYDISCTRIIPSAVEVQAFIT